MKNYLFFFILISILLLGCGKYSNEYEPVHRCRNYTRNSDSINAYIKGYWEWVEELRVSRNGVQYITPDSPGQYRLNISFLGDTARFYINSKADSVYRFKIQRESEITNYPPDSIPVLAYYSFKTGKLKWYVPVLVCKNQILMQYQYVRSIAGEHLFLRR